MTWIDSFHHLNQFNSSIESIQVFEVYFSISPFSLHYWSVCYAVYRLWWHCKIMKEWRNDWMRYFKIKTLKTILFDNWTIEKFHNWTILQFHDLIISQLDDHTIWRSHNLTIWQFICNFSFVIYHLGQSPQDGFWGFLFLVFKPLGCFQHVRQRRQFYLDSLTNRLKTCECNS